MANQMYKTYRVSTPKPNPLPYIGGIVFAILWLVFGLLLMLKLETLLLG